MGTDISDAIARTQGRSYKENLVWFGVEAVSPRSVHEADSALHAHLARSSPRVDPRSKSAEHSSLQFVA